MRFSYNPRAREKAYREKRKAAKIAANGGVSVPPKVCPHCGREFTPASNRQIFCSDECCYQARQDKIRAGWGSKAGEIIVSDKLVADTCSFVFDEVFHCAFSFAFLSGNDE